MLCLELHRGSGLKREELVLLDLVESLQPVAGVLVQCFVLGRG